MLAFWQGWHYESTRSTQKYTEGIDNMYITWLDIYFMAGQPTPLTYPPARNKGLIAGLIKGNQW